ETVKDMLTLKKYIDVLIPRGSAQLIDFVVEHATIPVLETGAGNCHVYIDATAKTKMAEDIVLNAKVQRPSVCNAVETVLIHEAWAKKNLLHLLQALKKQKVELHVCENTLKLVAGKIDVTRATEEDWKTEYLDYILAVKVVADVQEAVKHINTYGTKHSETIITEAKKNVEYFMTHVDAAVLYHNASTRFTDGFMFGFGAEIGISNQKLHARGPMALPELTTYQYRMFGKGQVRD
ncbi:MAG: glutamate-5-semialdehyde dehydrogenase, partial [Deltaproteobacteria bacterium CG_4_10_14_0_2_um_filter_43_8]